MNGILTFRPACALRSARRALTVAAFAPGRFPAVSDLGLVVRPGRVAHSGLNVRPDLVVHPVSSGLVPILAVYDRLVP